MLFSDFYDKKTDQIKQKTNDYYQPIIGFL
ncbi:hypothetical protein LKI_10130 [Leuconostoc kimchii IMSNU 11154]|uniref:Uncharacterized protein n=1 Tax=Leuconostoc kimchii (strain IMSNU 11154 / KCTC 2386 / IH25) TaxID=762051 RepID=D5T580_LEUKI|nr:hypothetical protein LKI_10130 [Leuconostoc kimchii IMSNU 11154]